MTPPPVLDVWAPRARRLDLLVGDRRLPFRAGDGGHWQREPPPPGVDYALSIDGGPPRPDPLSRWQPHGVHGPSRWIDLDGFAWTDAGFQAGTLATAVIYELHVGTFSPTGTFDGAIAHLDHLAALGVTHVELMPVATFPGRRGWGYDNVLLGAVHDAYGGPAGLHRFVDACHARDLAVVIDVVWNHVGADGAYLRELGPYLHEGRHTPWGPALNLDGDGSDEVRGFLLACARRWLVDYHADGLRLDAVDAMIDDAAIPFVEELAGWVGALAGTHGRALTLIAESDRNDPRLVQRPPRGGLGLDAQWSDDLHHAIHAAITGERAGYYVDFGRVADVATALTRGFVYDGKPSRYRGHRHGRPLVDVSGHRLIGYAQTHDQVGNRPRGERLVHLAGHDLARVAAALVFVAPHTPMLFQGEEWAASTPFPYFAELADPLLAAAMRDGRRRDLAELGWTSEALDPTAADTFAAAVLRWPEVEAEPHRDMLSWYRALIALRRARPELRDGRWAAVDARTDEVARWLAIGRGAVTLVANLGAAPHVHRVGPGELALGSRLGVRLADGMLELPPASCGFVVA